jgi:hypothetical protein
MSEHDFRAIRQMGHIVSVEARWEMTSVDTAREWLEVETRAGGVYTLPLGWHRVLKFVGYASVPGLFALTHVGERMVKSLDDIDKWEAKNKAERAQYKRLKAKFEGKDSA